MAPSLVGTFVSASKLHVAEQGAAWTRVMKNGASRDEMTKVRTMSGNLIFKDGTSSHWRETLTAAFRTSLNPGLADASIRGLKTPHEGCRASSEASG